MSEKLTDRAAWKALEAHAGEMSGVSLRALFEASDRAERFSLRVEMLMEGESRSDERVMQGIWQGAFQELQHYFTGISLEKLVDDYARLTDVEPIMFNI